MLCLKTENEVFYFFCKERVGRYIWPNNVNHVRNALIKKYSYKEIGPCSGDIVVEVGANVGEFTTAVAKFAKCVIAFEPDPLVVACLKKNTDAYPNCIVVEQAVGDKVCTIGFYISSMGADSSAIEPSNYSEKICVDVVTLDNYLEKLGIQQVDFLKIDAEGFEPEVLGGASNILRNTRKTAIDCGPERRGEYTLKQCKSILDQHHFTVYQRRNMLFGQR